MLPVTHQQLLPPFPLSSLHFSFPSSLSLLSLLSSSLLCNHKNRETAAQQSLVFCSSSSMAEVVDSIPDPSSPQKTQDNPFRFFSSFLFKSFFFAVLVFFIPLFPSQAPEFVSQTLLNRSWELIHLLLVGIAVSYGLFSRRNVDQVDEKEVSYKHDSSESYVSQVLQVASVFDDDDAESPPSGFEVGKAHLWNSMYYRGEPKVVVAEGNPGNAAGVSKPLFLPVRSLKPRALGPEVARADEVFDGCSQPSAVHHRSMSMGRIGSVKSGENGGAESIVLPSPIPWRSRSGRMEVKAESGTVTPPPCPLPPPAVETDTATFRSRSFSRRTRRLSPSPSPSPSPSSSPDPELKAKTSEDLVKKRSFHKSTPPPPPPPPPPHFTVHKSQQVTYNNHARKSFNDELKDLSRSGGREFMSSTNVISSSAEEKTNRGQNPRPPVTPTPKNQAEKKDRPMRKFIIDSDDEDWDTENASKSSTDDDVEEEDEVEEASNSAVEPEADANEVDKKADEFIAKFREQIRLQRINSIKRSTEQQRKIRSPK